MTTKQPNVGLPAAELPRREVPLGFAAAWSWPLTAMDGSPIERFACRAVASSFGRLLRQVDNSRVATIGSDPYILALNHSQRLEAVVIPAWLALLRGGRRVHFMADWNFLLIPMLGYAIRAGRSIIVGRKAARPAFLNRFKSRLVPSESPMLQAQRLLIEGHSVGIFVEGTTNRNPKRLLRGLTGAARLSLTTRARIIPAGVVFPEHDGNGPVGDFEPFRIRFGEPITPPALPTDPGASVEAERQLHSRVMTSISALSGKHWSPENPRTKHAN